MALTLAASRARLVRSRLAVVMALILMALLVPLVHSLLEARPARVHLRLAAETVARLLQPEQGLLARSRRLLVAPLRRAMRLGSSNLARRRSRRSNRCHLQALRMSRARLPRARDSMRPGESNFRRFPHSWWAPRTTATSSGCSRHPEPMRESMRESIPITRARVRISRVRRYAQCD
jgi:hypothetical protein